ncbi:Xaa-Pro aminopeptidase [Flavitalea sp. BT771]|uniref:aminopeptidase P family protein n=1 Tax=Flavitalea sp. BT771 TaxID=3063329 RepID=UPI0026E16EB2|nr:aminopeptidase P family protein [Flavitalea sp. BT771]MDO6431796.1 Xaa-Pro aminopeptidase [Flavitalea sp. BT771]MDV6220705.1 Xaa-Pro aminopeptidase [Flavitalea sp. BT771]
MKYFAQRPELFTANRARFIKEMLPGSIAVFVSNDEMPSNGDAHYPFRQNSNLFWLSGISQEDSMVIFFPDHPDVRYREVLVLVRPNEVKEKWDGRRLRADEARAISGIKTIVWLDMLDTLLQQWVHLAENIYLSSNENDRRSGPALTREYRFIMEMQERFPLHRYLRSAVIIRQLRAVKTSMEIGLMQTAVDITHTAFDRLLTFIRPGVMEYEVEAEIYHSFISQKSSGPAYSSIVASGDRARTLHYITNDQECKDGELVLMDFGADYSGYSADLTRTVPVSGRFTKRQKEVYNACLHLHQFAKSLLKPGLTFSHYNKKIGEEAGKTFEKIGLLTKADIRNQSPEHPAYFKYMYHGISHHLGIDVHDLGPRAGAIEEGMVLTVEPGIYIEEEQVGVRIENDVWITRGGCKDLMAKVPITVEEIEAAMKGKAKEGRKR